MQTRRLPLAALGFVAAGTALFSAFGQGSLTPPAGPAGPTMRTLLQVEPRIPLAAGSPGVTVNANGGFTISAPGSYYLTSNLTVAAGNGIVITAGDVALDLMGFTVASTNAGTASGDGVSITGSGANIRVRNGSIRSGSTFNFQTGETTNTGFSEGVEAELTVGSVSVSGITVAGVWASAFAGCGTVENCQVKGAGLGVYNGNVVRDSNFDQVRDGIQTLAFGLVSRCRVSASGGTSSSSVLNARGIVASGGVISECSVSASSHNARGIDAGSGAGSTVSNCSVHVFSTSGSGTITGIRNAEGQTVGCRVDTSTPSGGASVGIDAVSGLVSQCHVGGEFTAGLVAIKAASAVACFIAAGTATITNRYNMPASP